MESRVDLLEAARSVPAKTLVGAAELLAMPRGRARYELIRGELITMSPGGTRHGIIASRIDRRLAPYVELHQLGEVTGAETGFLIEVDPDTVRAPDCAFISRERIPADGWPDEYFPGAPDLAIEVVSPDDRISEVERKVAVWFKAGTRRVWVVNPIQRSLTDYAAPRRFRVLPEADEVDGGEVIPGFRCRVSEFFPAK